MAVSKPHKYGFTLVELSIVLVIIGLLIGGILIGQNLINSAKINGYVKKLQQYEIANEQFVLKFKSIPGDSPYLIPPGNNNNILDNVGGCHGIYSRYEPYSHWFHLKQSGFNSNIIGPESAGCGGVSASAGQILPLFSQYGGQKYYVNYSKSTGVVNNWDGIMQSDTRLYLFRITTIDYLALDEKMDGQSSSKIHANSEYSWSWANNPPQSTNNELIDVVYSPDRQLSAPERDAFSCTYLDCSG